MSKKSKHDYDYNETAAAPDATAEVPPEERAKDLLASMTLAAKHNSPVTPLMLSEVAALIGHITGQAAPAALHAILDSRGLPGNVTFRTADGAVQIIDTVEEALTYVRSLPLDVQKRPHWVAADKALTEAMTYVSGDVSAAVRQFEAAIAKDRELEPRAVEVPPRDPSLEPPPPAPAAEPEPTHA